MYQWKWSCVEGKRKSASTRAFDMFYDCVEDARSHGAEVDLEHVHKLIAGDNANVKLPLPRP